MELKIDELLIAISKGAQRWSDLGMFIMTWDSTGRVYGVGFRCLANFRRQVFCCSECTPAVRFQTKGYLCL